MSILNKYLSLIKGFITRYLKQFFQLLQEMIRHFFCCRVVIIDVCTNRNKIQPGPKNQKALLNKSRNYQTKSNKLTIQYGLVQRGSYAIAPIHFYTRPLGLQHCQHGIRFANRLYVRFQQDCRTNVVLNLYQFTIQLS